LALFFEVNKMKLIETLGVTIGAVLFIGAARTALGDSVDWDDFAKGLLMSLLAGAALHQSFKNIKA